MDYSRRRERKISKESRLDLKNGNVRISDGKKKKSGQKGGFRGNFWGMNEEQVSGILRAEREDGRQIEKRSTDPRCTVRRGWEEEEMIPEVVAWPHQGTSMCSLSANKWGGSLPTLRELL